MFKRIIYDEWTNIVPHISFWLTFGVFLAITARAFFMQKSKLSHLENLPLAEDDDCNSKPIFK